MGAGRTRGFTLIELVVVVCIVAILLVLTLPAYQSQLRSTRRALAGAALQEVMMRQEQYFLDYKRYAATLTDLDYPTHPFAIDEQGSVVAESAESRIYLIELATRANAYTLFAAPQFGQAADQLCGTLSLDSTGVRQASGVAVPRDCW